MSNFTDFQFFYNHCFSACLILDTPSCSRLRRSPSVVCVVEKCAAHIFPPHILPPLRGSAARSSGTRLVHDVVRRRTERISTTHTTSLARLCRALIRYSPCARCGEKAHGAYFHHTYYFLYAAGLCRATADAPLFGVNLASGYVILSAARCVCGSAPSVQEADSLRLARSQILRFRSG
jgi:hypothetical protein